MSPLISYEKSTLSCGACSTHVVVLAAFLMEDFCQSASGVNGNRNLFIGFILFTVMDNSVHTSTSV